MVLTMPPLTLSLPTYPVTHHHVFGRRDGMRGGVKEGILAWGTRRGSNWQ